MAFITPRQLNFRKLDDIASDIWSAALRATSDGTGNAAGQAANPVRPSENIYTDILNRITRNLIQLEREVDQDQANRIYSEYRGFQNTIRELVGNFDEGILSEIPDASIRYSRDDLLLGVFGASVRGGAPSLADHRQILQCLEQLAVPVPETRRRLWLQDYLKTDTRSGFRGAGSRRAAYSRVSQHPNLLRVVILERLCIQGVPPGETETLIPGVDQRSDVYTGEINAKWASDAAATNYEEALNARSGEVAEQISALRTPWRTYDSSFKAQADQLESDAEPLESIEDLFSREGEILATLTPQITKQFELYKAGDYNFRALRNVVQITDENFTSLPSILGATHGAQRWFDASNKTLSAIVPKVKFLKRNYIFDDENSSYEFESEIPLRLEYYFTERALNALTNPHTAGKGGGYGVKSISIESLGSTLGSERIMQRVNVTLFAQSLKDLLPENIEDFGKANDDSPFQLILSGYNQTNLNGAEPQEVSEGHAPDGFVDLFQGPILQDNFSGRKQDIILELGWAVDPDLEHSDVDVRGVARYLNSQSTPYVLNQVQFTFSFNDDGSFTLNVEFFGRIDFILNENSVNILQLLGSEDSFLTGYEQERAATRRLRMLNQVSQDSDSADDALATALVASESRSNILNNYSSFLNKLFRTTKLYRLILDRNLILEERDQNLETAIEVLQGDPDVEDEEALEGLLLQKFNIESITNASVLLEVLSPPQGSDEGDANSGHDVSKYFALDDIQNALEGQEVENARDLLGRTAEDTAASLLFDADRYNAYTVPFFRLGDILDVIVGQMREKNLYQGVGDDLEPYFMSGPIVFTDFVENRKVLLNVCDILISLRQFREFFMDEIVLKLRTNMGFQTFVRKLVSEFSQRNALTAVIDDATLPRSAQVVFTSFEHSLEYLPEILEDNSILIPNITTLMPSPRDNPSHLPTALDNIYKLVNHTRPLYLFQAYEPAIAQPRVNPDDPIELWKQKDFDRGIYWFEFGRDRGILKNASFSKLETPGLRDVAILGAQQALGFVRAEPYNVTLTLYGTPFLYPAQYIYFNPTHALGIDVDSYNDVTLFGRLIQIGGYYFVTRTNHQFDAASGMFETKLECVYQASPTTQVELFTINDVAASSLIGRPETGAELEIPDDFHVATRVPVFTGDARNDDYNEGSLWSDTEGADLGDGDFGTAEDEYLDLDDDTLNIPAPHYEPLDF
jgi:hypothetical protein